MENLETALEGIHAGLEDANVSPFSGYTGVAIYSEWEMDAAEWAWFRTNFAAAR